MFMIDRTRRWPVGNIPAPRIARVMRTCFFVTGTDNNTVQEVSMLRTWVHPCRLVHAFLSE